MDSQKVVELSNITLKYGEKVALSNIDLNIIPGEFIGVIGPNGSGKTTLLKLILGLLKPTSGKIEIFGKQGRLTGRMRSKIGYIPQNPEIDRYFPIKVIDVAMMGRYAKYGFFRNPGKEDKKIVIESLEKVGMKDYANTPFGQLSSGQQQRVAVARVLAQQPEMLLLDEPTANIDIGTQNVIMNLIDEIHRLQTITTFYVAHEINLLSQYLDRVVCLNQSVYKIGSPKEVLNEEVLGNLYQVKVTMFPHNKHYFFLIG
ncbi:MAG: metal ABC transporter ATP-binding protein [Nitrospirota bacterium]